jgi:hypothetical protein
MLPVEAHLVLNHVPLVALVIGLVFFIAGLKRASESSQHAGLRIFVATGVAVLLVSGSGLGVCECPRGSPLARFGRSEPAPVGRYPDACRSARSWHAQWCAVASVAKHTCLVGSNERGGALPRDRRTVREHVDRISRRHTTAYRTRQERSYRHEKQVNQKGARVSLVDASIATSTSW